MKNPNMTISSEQRNFILDLSDHKNKHWNTYIHIYIHVYMHTLLNNPKKIKRGG